MWSHWYDPVTGTALSPIAEDPAAVAARVATATKGFGVTVKDIRQQSVQTASSITTIDLTGISRLEQAFAIVLAAAAMWLFVNLVVSERRHEFATMAALGASLRDIGAFVRSEAVAVLGAALACVAWLIWGTAGTYVAEYADHAHTILGLYEVTPFALFFKFVFLVVALLVVLVSSDYIRADREPTEYYALLLRICDGSTSKRPELSRAKELVAQK